MSALAEKIRDGRFLRLIRSMLKAGYLEDWQYHATLSGTPQGGVVSPILSNIYLDKLDQYVERVLIPRHTRGTRRRLNPQYAVLANKRWRAVRRGDRASAREPLRRMRAIPCNDPMDPGYRRLRYIRYADDHLLGFAGPRAEAEQIRAALAVFLRETLRLELNQDKTLITRARSQRARFLGYDIIVQHCNTKISRDRRAPNGSRSANGSIALLVPPDVIKAKCAPYRQRGKPARRAALLNRSDYDIVRVYGAEYRGIVNYYLLATNVARLSALRWNAETSMLKTLAAKHNSSAAKMRDRHRAVTQTPRGPRTCYEARITREGRQDLVARFGGIPLTRDKNATIADPVPVSTRPRPRDLIQRLTARWCELCERHAVVTAHQIARLADLGQPGQGQPAWAVLMAQKRRKTLVVCAECHQHIHASPVTRAA